jgi:hypothetical protein
MSLFDFQFFTKNKQCFYWVIQLLAFFLAFCLTLHRPIQIDDWRDIAMLKDHTKPPRARTLGANITLSGFGLENVGQVYLDTATYVLLDLIKILSTHLTFHDSCDILMFFKIIISVLQMINQR